MKKFIPVIVLLLVGAAVFWNQLPPRARAQLTYSGVVEVTTVDHSFEISGTLVEVRVVEGDLVHKGDLLCRVDDATAKANLAQAKARQGAAQAKLDELLAGNRPAEIAQAQARLEQAQADLQQAVNGPTLEELRQARAASRASHERFSVVEEGSRREDIAVAKHQLEAAQSNLLTNRTDYLRYQRLRKEGAISDQTLEGKKNLFDDSSAALGVAQENYLRTLRGPRRQERRAALADYRATAAHQRDLENGTRPELIERARATVSERLQALQLMKEGARKEQIQSARQQLVEAKAAVEAAQVLLGKTTVVSSCDGIVITRTLEPGAAVNPGLSVISVGDLAHPWVNIYVPETELPRIKLDQKGTIHGDGLSQPIAGKVTRIYEKAEFTPKFIQTPRERINLVFRSKVTFENPELRLRPGQPADVELQQP